jgi:hypothetical protein
MKLTNNRYMAAFAVLALTGTQVHAANTGINTLAPKSQLSVNGNFAVGATYAATYPAPANGAIIEGASAIGTPVAFPTIGGMLNVNTPTVGTGYPNITCGTAGIGRLMLVTGLNNTQNNSMVSNGDQAILFTNTGSQNPAGDTGLVLGPFASTLDTGGGLRIQANGATGINQKAPLAALHVSDTYGFIKKGGVAHAAQRAYFNGASGVNLLRDGAMGTDALILATGGNIVTDSYVISVAGPVTASDERLKNIIGHSDSGSDLEILKQISITDYTMKDSAAFGSTPFKKVIAQQVEKVFPQAVKNTGVRGIAYFPDIYSLAKSVTPEAEGIYTLTLPTAHALKRGDTVKLINEDGGDVIVKVRSVTGNAFSVETTAKLASKVFVYGKESLDMKGVDYEAIAMLNVSATQELAKKMDVQDLKLAALEKENAELKSMAVELKELKALVATLKGDKPAAALETVSLSK